MRRRQYRPRPFSPGDEPLALEREMETWLRRHLVRGDNPPGLFRRWQAFLGEWQEWSRREEADYARWCLMEDETSHEDADVELRAIVSVDEPTPRATRPPLQAAHATFPLARAA